MLEVFGRVANTGVARILLVLATGRGVQALPVVGDHAVLKDLRVDGAQ